MIHPPRAHNTVGAIALILVIFADIGLAVWYWNWKHSRPRPYSSAGFDVSSTEIASPSAEPRPPYAQQALSADRGLNPPVPDRASSATTQKVIKTPRSPSVAGIPPRGNHSLSKAAAVVYALQKQDKYRQSPVIQRWTRDFLSHPDLRRINTAYWKDRDVKTFVLSTLRSPHFAKMLKDYASSPDILSFAKDLAASPEILSAGRILAEDKNVMAAAKNVTLPGLLSLGTLMSAGEGMSGHNQAQALEKLKNDPNFRKFMQSQDIPPVALQEPAPGQLR